MENNDLKEADKSEFLEIAEIRDIIASANMGIWRIELVDGEEPRMFVDDTMKRLLGVEGQERTPEKTYTDWFCNIKPEAVQSVLDSVERMKQGYFDENTYLWIHPSKGVRYVRCGGSAQSIPGGFSLRGYHYDVDDVVRKEQKHMIKLQETLNEKNEYYSTLGRLGNFFYTMHVIDLTDDTAVEFNSNEIVKEIVNHKNGATQMMRQIMRTTIVDEFKNIALEFTDLSTIAERLKNKKIISQQLLGKNRGWILATFILMEKGSDGLPTKVIFTTRIIDEAKRYEAKLIQRSQTDEMTGLLNRRAYEEDIYAHNDTPSTDEFAYISLDVNGLKVINDSKGHLAGDELIIGACQCMKKSFGPYGKIYRIGGDEFVAIVFCDNNMVNKILRDFDNTIANWKGTLIDSLSISYGWTSKSENPYTSVRQLGAIAEARMYESKDEFYKKSGTDRRGQQDAHKLLCDSYTKILKINVTTDSYNIINMNDDQILTNQPGDKISEWLTTFGTSDMVHPDDLDEYLRVTDINYLREYFKGDKSSFITLYRRKYGNDFKQVMMEIIPANDYSDENQSLFLYVKSIDK